jgi:drug/metabolite transporter (DMT)-like permease
VTAAPRRPRRPPQRRRSSRLIGLAIGGAVLVFLVGIAFGQALDDNSAPGGTQTMIRTLKPLQLPPAARETVTVTTTAR